jgi:hypothetical protein
MVEGVVPDLSYFDRHPPFLVRSELKDLLAHGGIPPVALVAAKPFAGQLTQFNSPEDAEREFYIKKVGVGENIARQNLASKVRYIQGDSEGEVISERDFPMGDLQLATVVLTLADWKLSDGSSKIPLTEKNIKTYLSPREFSFLYAKALEVNPLWGAGEDEEKNA